ncbi:GNAT family N-acetyltransferase [Cryptosporangium arvum]|uniref:GNAT family N-acetyltransferase n=1 Tax=Cryptosporangium arvum TaxID=80871 RepID=UPI0004B846A2|nr:GNAT family protein [Cryptosporangium arvum]
MDDLRFRPVAEKDLVLFQRLRTDPEFWGPGWPGFDDPGQPARRLASDGYFSESNSWLVAERGPDAVALLNWRTSSIGAPRLSWEIGIVVVPERRGQGIGWRAQAMLCDYLFDHGPVQRIQAGTRVENIAEQKSLVKAGFQLEGRVRAAEFADGEWRDGLLYSRLRTDPAPDLS